MGQTSDEAGQIKLYEPLYAEPVEDALFTMLLHLIKIKDPVDAPEKPFAVPWVYSFTNDPFSEPPSAPDPSLLPDDEMPRQSNYFECTKAEIEDALGKRWNRLQAAETRTADAGANFHPLTKHFFLKAFREGGVDEIVALISCIEATLMLPKERADKLLKRYKRLVNDDTALCWLKLAYTVRNRYLHSLGGRQPSGRTSPNTGGLWQRR
jgi:hypothetical protein